MRRPFKGPVTISGVLGAKALLKLNMTLKILANNSVKNLNIYFN